MLNIDGLQFNYPDNSFKLKVDHLEFKKGEVTALVGGNGSGKTTLFRLLAGVYEPLFPCFSYDAVKISHHRKLNCNIVLHNAHAGINSRLTVLQNAQLIARLYCSNSSVSHIKKLALSLNIEDLLYKKSNMLSAGQSRKALLLRTMASDPDIVLLDEPTTGLDIVGIEVMLCWIKSLSDAGKIVIVSTHHLYELGILRPKVVGLRGGSIVCQLSSIDDMSSPDKAREIIHSIIG